MCDDGAVRSLVVFQAHSPRASWSHVLLTPPSPGGAASHAGTFWLHFRVSPSLLVAQLQRLRGTQTGCTGVLSGLCPGKSRCEPNRAPGTKWPATAPLQGPWWNPLGVALCPSTDCHEILRPRELGFCLVSPGAALQNHSLCSGIYFTPFLLSCELHCCGLGQSLL